MKVIVVADTPTIMERSVTTPERASGSRRPRSRRQDSGRSGGTEVVSRRPRNESVCSRERDRGRVSRSSRSKHRSRSRSRRSLRNPTRSRSRNYRDRHDISPVRNNPGHRSRISNNNVSDSPTMNECRPRNKQHEDQPDSRINKSKDRSRSPLFLSAPIDESNNDQNIKTSADPPVLPSSNQSTQDIASMFKEFIHVLKNENNNKLPERFSFNNNNAVPEFDPMKKNQTIDMWITKVNECASIYNWSEREIIHYALPKLSGVAQRWYQGLPSVLFSWNEWQEKLKTAFPSSENYGQLLSDMLALRAKFGDSLENYFYDKMILINRCKITGKEAVDCILFGIDDRSVRTGAEAVQFTDPDKLLVYLRNVKTFKRPDRSTVPYRTAAATDQTIKAKPLRYENKIIKCYNCGQEGHPSFKCKLPLKKCDTCFKLGHVSTDCPSKNTVTKPNNSVMLVCDKDLAEDKYFKLANVNGNELHCYIDFGSQCTMMRLSDAKDVIGTWQENDLPVLRGFGNGTVEALGKAVVRLTIDSVEAETPVLIVPDITLRVPLLVGQTYTEQDHIAILKTSESLHIASKYPDTDKILLYTVEDTLVNGLGKIDIYTEPKFTGDLFIEHKLRQEPRKEYEIIPGFCQIIDGKGQLVLRGFPNREFVMPKDNLLFRTAPANTLEVNLVENDYLPDNKSTISVDDIAVDKDVNSEVLSKLVLLLNEYRDCFAFSNREIGCTNITKMEIHLNDPTPVVYRPYRMSHSERESVREIINDLESCGIIRESCSEYASPIVLVKKKTGENRMCVDFRALNKKTVKKHYPIPRIEDQIDNLSGFKYYTTLDLASGYYQIPMSEESKHLTAFVTPDAHYEFNRMPFGLANAPSTFQRTINKVLGNARFQHAFAYMDDIIIPSLDTESGLDRLRGVLDLLRENHLTLKLSKCNFFKEKIDYLGFEISSEGVRPGSRKIDAVQNFPKPVDQHTVRQFIGLASYFRRFIEGFSLIARPLTQLLKKDSKFQWQEAQENAFVTLRDALVQRPVLGFYDPTSETQLHTDASKIGIGGVLLQRKTSDQPFKPVAYYSRQTSQEEQHYTSYDLETLAVVCSLQRFRVYLLGVPFKVITDCQSLRATFEKKDMIPRVARWWNSMQEYDFTMEYRPGVNMAHVDALSRNPTNVLNVETDFNVANVSVDWITTAQKNDPEIRRTLEILNDKDLDKVPDIKTNFVCKGGLLYRKTDNGDRWVVPKGVTWHVLKANHDQIGHFSFDKTYDKIKSDYWWPKMRRTIQKYVESCLECAHSKGQGGKKPGELHPIPKDDCPFQTIHFDHLGPFIRSRKKNCYLFVIIDAFTKFAVLVPVKNTKSSTSIKALRNYCHLFGVPKRVISDRGSGFTSKSFKAFLSSLGIKQILNAVATPRANGQVERYNRTILSALTSANQGKPENQWDEFVSEVQWGLNNTINQGIGKTPAQALFGLRMTGMGDACLRANIQVEDSQDENNLDSMRKEISERVEKSQLKQKERFDKHRKQMKFKVGDLVRIEREIPATGQSRKLVAKYQGPYRITQMLGHDRYEVCDTPVSRKNRPFKSVISVDKLLPWLVFDRNLDEGEENNTDDLNFNVNVSDDD